MAACHKNPPCTSSPAATRRSASWSIASTRGSSTILCCARCSPPIWSPAKSASSCSSLSTSAVRNAKVLSDEQELALFAGLQIGGEQRAQQRIVLDPRVEAIDQLAERRVAQRELVHGAFL